MNEMLDYIKDHYKYALLLILCGTIFCFVFSLYNLEIEAILYSFALCFFLLLITFIIDFILYQKKHSLLQALQSEICYSIDRLPTTNKAIEQLYQELITLINQEKIKIEVTSSSNNQDLLDYYTLWLHQIKTPIAAIDLMIQENPSDENSRIQLELIKIEQYVSMVLTYVRLGSESTDYLFKKYDIYLIIKQAIHKFAPIFIHQKISLKMDPFDYLVVTDEKWLLFVIEQILTNALKYTKNGTIHIYLDSHKLVIEDTGIGIVQEDLERIFEKGYTGFNGRTDKVATGLGLYLSKKIMSNLNHQISIQSIPNKGTKVILDLDRTAFDEL